MFKFLELEDDVPYWNTNENNFIILCLLLTNKIFNNDEFSKLYLQNFIIPTDTCYYKIYNEVQESITMLCDFELKFKDKLLNYNTCIDINKVKNNFFTLSFNKKYYLVETYKNYIMSMMFLGCYANFINLDGNYFYTGLIKDKSTKGVLQLTNSNAIEELFLKNYFFTYYVNISNILELYTSFLSYSHFNFNTFNTLGIKNLIKYNSSKNNISEQLIKSKKFLFFKDFDSKLILSEQNDGVGIFSKKFQVSVGNNKNSMIFFIKKDNNGDLGFFNIVNFIPYSSNKNNKIKISPKSLKNKIPIIYDKKYNLYNFGNFILSAGTISKNSLEIYFSYDINKKIVIINIKNTENNAVKIEKLYYKFDTRNIYRVIGDKQYLLATINTIDNKKSKVQYEINLNVIVLPYEFILIAIGGYLLFLNKSSNKSIYQQSKQLLKESKQSIYQQTKKISGMLKTDNYKKQLDSINLEYLKLHKHDSDSDKSTLLDIIASKCDSIIFKYFYYRAKQQETIYFKDAMKDELLKILKESSENCESNLKVLENKMHKKNENQTKNTTEYKSIGILFKKLNTIIKQPIPKIILCNYYNLNNWLNIYLNTNEINKLKGGGENATFERKTQNIQSTTQGDDSENKIKQVKKLLTDLSNEKTNNKYAKEGYLHLRSQINEEQFYGIDAKYTKIFKDSYNELKSIIDAYNEIVPKDILKMLATNKGNMVFYNIDGKDAFNEVDIIDLKFYLITLFVLINISTYNEDNDQRITIDEKLLIAKCIYDKIKSKINLDDKKKCASETMWKIKILAACIKERKERTFKNDKLKLYNDSRFTSANLEFICNLDFDNKDSLTKEYKKAIIAITGCAKSDPRMIRITNEGSLDPRQEFDSLLGLNKPAYILKTLNDRMTFNILGGLFSDPTEKRQIFNIDNDNDFQIIPNENNKIILIYYQCNDPQPFVQVGNLITLNYDLNDAVGPRQIVVDTASIPLEVNLDDNTMKILENNADNLNDKYDPDTGTPGIYLNFMRNNNNTPNENTNLQHFEISNIYSLIESNRSDLFELLPFQFPPTNNEELLIKILKFDGNEYDKSIKIIDELLKKIYLYNKEKKKNN